MTTAPTTHIPAAWEAAITAEDHAHRALVAGGHLRAWQEAVASRNARDLTRELAAGDPAAAAAVARAERAAIRAARAVGAEAPEDLH